MQLLRGYVCLPMSVFAQLVYWHRAWHVHMHWEARRVCDPTGKSASNWMPAEAKVRGRYTLHTKNKKKEAPHKDRESRLKMKTKIIARMW